MKYLAKPLSIIFFLLGLGSIYLAYIISTFNNAWEEPFSFKEFFIEGLFAIIYAVIFFIASVFLWKKSKLGYILISIVVIYGYFFFRYLIFYF